MDNVELWFVQIGSHDKSPEDVEDLIGEYPATVWDDDPDQTIWTAFASTWYEAVLLDPEDCIVAKFGPFTKDPIDPAVIIPLWKGAALGTLPCDDPEPEPELGPETIFRPEVDEDVVEVVDVVEPEPVPEPEPDIYVADALEVLDLQEEIVDTISDVPADVPADIPADIPPDTPPDLPGDIPEVPPWWCQIATVVEPPVVGDALPWFTCTDMNPVSATSGEVISKASMKELVWLAYAGSGG